MLFWPLLKDEEMDSCFEMQCKLRNQDDGQNKRERLVFPLLQCSLKHPTSHSADQVNESVFSCFSFHNDIISINALITIRKWKAFLGTSTVALCFLSTEVGPSQSGEAISIEAITLRKAKQVSRCQLHRSGKGMRSYSVSSYLDQ